MPTMRKMIAELRKEERLLAKQLEQIRAAIASLEFGSAGGVPRAAVFERRRPRRLPARSRRPAARKTGKKK